MAATSINLLDRLKRHPEAAAWKQFHDLYRPLIRRWLARIPGLYGPGLRNETDDLTQEVLVLVFRKIGSFERERVGSFRAWLRTLTVHSARDYYRKRSNRPNVSLDDGAVETYLSQLEAPGSPLAEQWDREHHRHVCNRLLAMIEPDFQPSTWAAFRRSGLEKAPAAAVAKELGMSEQAVVSAKARVLRRLREVAGGLLTE
jgi:RNA polymerase sigma-70 factor (ECF subfamily)